MIGLTRALLRAADSATGSEALRWEETQGRPPPFRQACRQQTL